MSIRMGEGVCGDVVLLTGKSRTETNCTSRIERPCATDPPVGRDRDGLRRPKLRTTEQADSTRRIRGYLYSHGDRRDGGIHCGLADSESGTRPTHTCPRLMKD
jgi:hypothetical protein